MQFGREYLSPKPFDPRVLLWEAPAVARAAIESGVAKQPCRDIGEYRERLERLLGRSREVMQLIFHKAQAAPHRLVFPEGEHETILRAARSIADQRIARPILLGRADVIADRAAQLGLELHDYEIVDPATSPKMTHYADALYKLRARKGMTPAMAAAKVADPIYFGLMMLREVNADGFVGGMYQAYPETIRPAIQIIGLRDGVSRVSAVQLLVLKDKLVFCADTMVNIEPTSEELAEIAILAADTAKSFEVEPKVALLSFSSFGSVRHPLAERVARAVDLVRAARPDIVVDGEMHLDTAVVEEIVRENYPQSRLKGDANILIFPNLAAGNIGYKLVHRLGRAEAIGPILTGMRRPVTVLQHGTTVADIVNLAAITAVAADMADGEKGSQPSIMPSEPVLVGTK
jgi:malate dehydrogenase (oxaloacetate-decarboxylating)(NADP+)